MGGSSSSPQPNSPPAVSPAPAKETAPIAFDDVHRDQTAFLGDNLTDTQRQARAGEWSNYKDGLQNYRAVAWEGAVVEAVSSVAHGHYIKVDVTGNGEIDVYLYCTNSQALSVNVGDHIRFDGQLVGLWPKVPLDIVEVDCTSMETAGA